ncbi:MAG: M12 family metallo-peptidase [Chloroflexota bacterium]
MPEKTYRFDLLVTLILIVLSGAFFYPFIVFGQQETPGFIQPIDSSLFFLRPNPSSASMISDAALWGEYVQVDSSFLTNTNRFHRAEEPIAIKLPGDAQLHLLQQSLETNDGSTAWIGRVIGTANGEATFVTRDGIVAGTINTGQALYRIRYGGDGVHLFEELSPTYLEAGEPLFPPEMPSGADEDHTELEHSIVVANRELNSDPVIDLLVLYTDAAEEAMGGATGTKATIELGLLESNQGFENSRINTRFRIAHTHKVALNESDYPFNDLLIGLRADDDGMIDEIHALRDRYGADVVTMIVDRPVLCGKSYQMTAPTTAFAEYAFSVLHYSCATGYYSLAHEIGHNLGSQHDHAHIGNAPGLFEWSYGFQDPDSRFRTIMAYNCVGGCARINHWSNPSVIYQNLGPTGVSTDRAFPSDNRLSINQTAPIVASFRDEVIPVGSTVTIRFNTNGSQVEDEPAISDDPNELIDTGAAYQTYLSGFTFGWISLIKPVTEEQPTPPAPPLDNPAPITEPAVEKAGLQYVESDEIGGAELEEDPLNAWEIALPQGRYRVRVSFGDSTKLAAGQGINLESDPWQMEELILPERQWHLLEGTLETMDGNLTIEGISDPLELHQLTITRVDDSTPLLAPLDPDQFGPPFFQPVFVPLIALPDA